MRTKLVLGGAGAGPLSIETVLRSQVRSIHALVPIASFRLIFVLCHSLEHEPAAALACC